MVLQFLTLDKNIKSDGQNCFYNQSICFLYMYCYDQLKTVMNARRHIGQWKVCIVQKIYAIRI